jgi:L-alanine-DL-glutamate epimerase-like enolase superfamily enzyme
MRELRVRELRIPFTATFRHASAERAETSSLWVEAVSEAGVTGYGESCPRPYVTGETLDSALAFVAGHRESLLREVDGLAALGRWMDAHAASIDANPAAWCAIEVALLDLVARADGVPVDTRLGLPPAAGPFRFSAVVGDGPIQAVAATAERYRRLGFTDFKIKLSGDAVSDRMKLDTLRRWQADGLRVRADANNLWPGGEEAIAALRALGYPLFAVEEPVAANAYGDLARIGDAAGCRIVLDESLLRAGQVEQLPGPAARWIANVRVSKMGGVLRALEVVRRAREAGLGVIVGAQVGETSLLTRAALTVATAAGPALVAQEGAFGTYLLAHDVCDPPLMFGQAGVLDVPPAIVHGPGWGLAVRDDFFRVT